MSLPSTNLITQLSSFKIHLICLVQSTGFLMTPEHSIIKEAVLLKEQGAGTPSYFHGEIKGFVQFQRGKLLILASTVD